MPRPNKAENKPPADHTSASSSIPGQGGLIRIWLAGLNSFRGIITGMRTEAAITQELFLASIGLLLSFFLAGNLWQWLALVGSLLLVLTVEFMNTAVERLCDHVTPEHHEQIRDIKDFGSASVFFMLVFAGLVWFAVLLHRLSLIGS